ncbi:hypothetical protein niasHT_002954 [Heterodera trifolii]|uniref:DNA2/NAM7 helicase-like C-terminal domain-containing protein n=1 Tax=Heterodera trifolii TaxID=157864 RepID=A0ABD2LQR0_9BILA
MPVADSPILLIHQDTLLEHELTSYSATNRGQTRTVMELLELLDNFPGSIRIISLYAGQAAQIGIELKKRGLESKIASMTSDAMQGHEADLTIIATTVSRQNNWTDWQRSNHAKDRKSEFWGDSQRVNVALSRGKHGIFAVCCLTTLVSLSKTTVSMLIGLQMPLLFHPHRLGLPFLRTVHNTSKCRPKFIEFPTHATETIAKSTNPFSGSAHFHSVSSRTPVLALQSCTFPPAQSFN